MVTAVEHSAVRFSAERAGGVTVVPVDGTGRVAVDDVLDAIGPSTVAVHVQWGNHEVGTVQPVAEVVAAYLDAYDFRPTRAESLCELARYLRLQQRYASAVLFARQAAALPLPDDLLFIDHGVYAWRARDEWAVASWYCGDGATSFQLCEALLAGDALPAGERGRVQNNLGFALQLLRTAG